MIPSHRSEGCLAMHDGDGDAPVNPTNLDEATQAGRNAGGTDDGSEAGVPAVGPDVGDKPGPLTAAAVEMSDSYRRAVEADIDEEDRKAALSRLRRGAEQDRRRLRAREFTIPRMRPCASIPPGDDDADGRFRSVRDRFSALEERLPLVGGLALRPTADGGIHLIEDIRTRAPWYGPALSVLERQLRLGQWSGRDWLQWRPLVLAGDPGVGKSHLARQLADLSSGHCAVLNGGGLDDVRMLAGTARGWRNAQPAWPVMVMSQGRVGNPILVVEEVDKVQGDRGAGVLDTLLAMLEPVTARAFYDSCLTADVDLSACCWILTVNDARSLPPALRSRVDVVHVDGPAPAHFPLVVDSLLEGIAGEFGVPPSALPRLPRRALTVFKEEFARRRSIRLLRRRIVDAVAVLLPAMPRAH